MGIDLHVKLPRDCMNSIKEREVLALFVQELGLPEEKMRIFREYIRSDRMLHFHRSRGMVREAGCIKASNDGQSKSCLSQNP